MNGLWPITVKKGHIKLIKSL